MGMGATINGDTFAQVVDPGAINGSHTTSLSAMKESVTQLKHIARQMDIVVRHILPSAAMPLFQAMGG